MNSFDSPAIREIKEALDQLRNALAKRLEEMEADCKARSNDIYAQVEKLKEFATSLGLHEKLLEIYEAVERGTDNHKLCDFETCVVERREPEKWVRFVFKGQPYSFCYVDKGPSLHTDGHYTRLALLDSSGAALIGINISVEFHREVNLLRAFGVDAFRQGPWVQDFLECYERFKANTKAKELSQQYDQTKLDDLKKRFGLS